MDLLNPTPRDVQLGAIIDQCVGQKAKKRIARRRIDIVTGNVNSYARILNGPTQLEKLKTYNQLAASMAEIQKEKDEKNEASRAEKKIAAVEKAAKKLQKEQKAREEHVRLFPICSQHVALGLDHVLKLTVPQKVAILKHVYNHPGAKKSLKMDRANQYLKDVMPAVPTLPVDTSEGEYLNNVNSIYDDFVNGMDEEPSNDDDMGIA